MLPDYVAPAPTPLHTHPSGRSGHTRRKTGTSVPAWPFGPVSVSLEKLSHSALAHAPFPAAPELFDFRSRIFTQAVFSYFLQIHVFSKAPSLHGHYPASSLLQAPKPTDRAPSGPRHGYLFPFRVGSAPPRRASQVPRQIFPHALFSTTPGTPASAYSFLPNWFQASSWSEVWPVPLPNEAESDSLALRLAGSPQRGFTAPGFPSPMLAGFMLNE